MNQRYTEEELRALSEATRYDMFVDAWERHTKAGLPRTQKEADRVAAMYFATAPKLLIQDDDDDGPRGGSGGSADSGGIMGLPDRYSDFRGKGRDYRRF